MTTPAAAPARVLFLNLNWIIGGQEVVLLDIIRGLDRTRYEPLAVCFAEGLLAETLRAEGVPTFVLPAHRLRQPIRLARAIATITALLVRERIALVHCNGDSLLFYGALAAAPLRVPCVWHVYEPVATHGNSYVRAIYLVQRQLRPAFTIFGTAAVEANYLRNYPRLGRHHVAIMPGVDAGELARDADADAARRELGIPRGAPILLVIARLQRDKGHRELLEAAARLPADVPPPHLVFCGRAPVVASEDDSAELRRRASELGLSDRLHMTGQAAESLKRNLLAAATALVHPAHREAFGIAVAEAMAVGKPVVVTDCVGPTTIVAGSGAGLIVPRQDVDALCSALEQLLRDPESARRMGERGAAHVRERFSKMAMVAGVERVYADVLARH